MTNSENDLLLQSLFAESKKELDADAFVLQVMNRTSLLQKKMVATIVTLALLLFLAGWMLDIPLAIAELITEVITATLFDFGNNWVGWALSPINNIAGLCVIGWRIYLFGRRRIFSATRIGVFAQAR